VNQQFRIQKFIQAIPPLAGAHNDLSVLAKLIASAGAAAPADQIGTLWPLIAAEVPVLASVLYKTIPDTGVLLDATTWRALPFVEDQTLHFKPAALAAANV
jgi:NADH-quinone oxidoreductase subunit G